MRGKCFHKGVRYGAWTDHRDHSSRQLIPGAPATSYYHGGAGTNRILVSPEHDLVVVRWVAPEQFDGFIERVLAAVKPVM